jgi:ADP-ribose pyrophosphatase YjhB (NUDIX family)
VLLIESLNVPGVWNFPGGSLDPGEDVAICAERETAEESGAHGVLGCFLGVRIRPAAQTCHPHSTRGKHISHTRRCYAVGLAENMLDSVPTGSRADVRQGRQGLRGVEQLVLEGAREGVRGAHLNPLGVFLRTATQSVRDIIMADTSRLFLSVNPPG